MSTSAGIWRSPASAWPSQFDRAYNSREASGGGASATPLGYGWTHSYQVRLTVDAGDVTITWGDGSTETYAPRRRGRLHAASTASSTR